MPEAKRQLAAIMFTDIVGYTALMGKDSNKALELIRISKDIQKPLVKKHNGKWLKEMGDGAMAQFSTALDAVNCSIEIQESARAKLDAKLRIGIHSGDITIENDDVYGDGVNVASRLESIADAGGIYISESIEKAIQGQTDVQAKYLGEVKLKNVAYGVRTYALQGVGLPVPEVKADKEVSGHFMAELQRRGVIRAGATYVVLSLLMILLVPYASSIINLPEWSTTALLVVLIIGFPIALYLAWNYERSPEGFVRTSSKESWQNPYTTGQRKPLTSNFVIAVVTLIILTMYIYPRFQSILSEDGEMEVAATIDNKTIAVIPFVDMSQEGDQEWFSDGMMEEILNHLVQIEDLKVTSRTSAMRFKGSEKSLQEIGKELSVAHILEGSVRKQGNKVRITVQLIDVESDQHLWSKTYDRNLDDVFAIQSEVAQLVASSLQAQVRPEVKMRIESQPTSNLEAYDLWLEGNYYYTNTNFEGSKSTDYWEKAIQMDSTFAPAYTSMGEYWLNEGGFGGNMEQSEILTEATYYLNQALKLDVDYPQTHLRLANLYLWYKWDFEAAEKELAIYRNLNPSSLPQDLTDFLNSSGRFAEAIEISEQINVTDNLLPRGWSSTGLAYYLTHQYEKGDEHYKKALNLFPDDWFLLVSAGRAFIYSGKNEKSIEVLTHFLTLYPDYRFPRVLASLSIAYYHTSELDSVLKITSELKKMSATSSTGSPSFYIAMIYSQMGEIDLAFEWLDKAYEDHEVEMHWLKVEPPFDPLRNDPRWQEMLDKVGFPD